MDNNGELTNEGNELWNNLDNPEYIENLAKAELPKEKTSISSDKKSSFYRKELTILAKYFDQQVNRWDALAKEYKQTEKFMELNEAIVQKILYRKFKNQIDNLLKGKQANPTMIVVEDGDNTEYLST